MLLFQYLGVLAMPLIIAVGALAFRRWRLAAALVLVVPLKLAAERMAKLLVERERPGTTVPDAILRGVHPAGLSFVSGHAIITFAVAGLLALVLPRRWGSSRWCWRPSTGSPGCTWARTTRWMWSAGPRSAWRSRPCWIWC
jgi:membrane-associated phospholipid phosphatase